MTYVYQKDTPALPSPPYHQLFVPFIRLMFATVDVKLGLANKSLLLFELLM